MKRLVALVLFITTLGFAPVAALAQNAFVQIEAHPSLQTAQNRIRAYSGSFTDVNGFRLGSGWYAVALGPYSEQDAANRMQTLKSQGLIPRDAYIAFARGYAQQFWPVGANALNSAPIATPSAPTTQAATVEPETPAQPIVDPEETPRQARRSEGELSREQREQLQTALQWEGFYDSAIDGAFGRGTRAAMSAWQEAMGYEVTGVLTTRQRTSLIESYNAVLEGLGLTTVVNSDAGIEVQIPGAMVEYSRLEPPFVHYDSKTDEGVKLLLISQSGNRATLHGLYDIMQTLEIVPREGDRQKGEDDFVLTGQNSDIHSYTYATHQNGLVKGFTLVWPAGDEKRMNRVIREMRNSFQGIDGVALDDLAGEPDEDQRIDLLAGLEIRQPLMSRSGFFIDDAGSVLTTAELGEQCQEITISDDQKVEVVLRDEALGIAVLQPVTPLAPIGFARFREGVARINSQVATAGFPFGGVLDAATLSFGELADIRGLRGEAELQRLTMTVEPGNAGGPVFDIGGAVIGMLQSHPSSGDTQLPADVNFAAKTQPIMDLLSSNGISVTGSDGASEIAPEDLTTLAMDMTVLVNCWN